MICLKHFTTSVKTKMDGNQDSCKKTLLKNWNVAAKFWLSVVGCVSHTVSLFVVSLSSTFRMIWCIQLCKITDERLFLFSFLLTQPQ